MAQTQNKRAEVGATLVIRSEMEKRDLVDGSQLALLDFGSEVLGLIVRGVLWE